MIPVEVRVLTWKKTGREVVEGTADLPNTNADTLQGVVDQVLGSELGSSVPWEAFFYNLANEGILVAYLSNNGEAPTIFDSSVLSLH